MNALRLLAAFLLCVADLAAQQVRYVIHVSVDGLRPDAVTALPVEALPNSPRAAMPAR